jgi:hypothetical protein
MITSKIEELIFLKDRKKVTIKIQFSKFVNEPGIMDKS